MNLRSIRVRLLGMITLLTIGFAFYLLRDISSNYFTLQESSRIASISEVAVADSALVHELQKERGLSAGFIGSKGAKFRSELETQRKDTDLKAKALDAAIKAKETDLPVAVRKRLAESADFLRQIDSRRTTISALSLPGPESFAFFTRGIELNLDAVSLVAPSLTEASMMRRFNAYVMFLQAKEQATSFTVTPSSGCPEPMSLWQLQQELVAWREAFRTAASTYSDTVWPAALVRARVLSS